MCEEAAWRQKFKYPSQESEPQGASATGGTYLCWKKGSLGITDRLINLCINMKSSKESFWEKWVFDDTGIFPRHLFTESYIGFLYVGSWNRQGNFSCFFFFFLFALKLIGASGWNYIKVLLFLSLLHMAFKNMLLIAAKQGYKVSY